MMARLQQDSCVPLVGLLYNPTVPTVLATLDERIDFLEIIPDRLWYDFGSHTARRFSHVTAAQSQLRAYQSQYRFIGHGIGLSLPSALPLDEQLLAEVVASHKDLQYQWYSEHLSMFLVPGRSVPNAQAGLGLPILLNAETLGVVSQKVRRLQQALGVPILLENSTIFAAIPEQEMSEPAFFNALYETTGCGLLLDLHNLYANSLNLGLCAEAYLAALNPDLVKEIHLAGGDWLKGHYTDSHSRPTPAPVWEWAYTWAPRFPQLAAITYEYHESYLPRLGVAGIAHEVAQMHKLAQHVANARQAVVTLC